MYRGVCILLALSISSFGLSMEAESDELIMSLEARDLVLGELSIMGDSPLMLCVENNGPTAVRLATGHTTRWMADSPYWSIHIDGPVDSRCAQYQAAAVRTPPPGVGFYEEIGAGETRRFALPSLGIGQEGEYRVRVEYNGERAKEGEYRGVVRTNESVFRILPPTPTEQEIVKQWLEENPELPWCIFPAGLEIFESHDLIVEYPTSLYAGWKLWGMIRGLAAAFPGAPSAVEPEVFLRTARESPNRVLGEQRIYSRENPKGTLLRTEAAARWRIEYLSAFLTAHGDFPKADEMRLRIAMDYIGLGDYKSAERQLEPVIRSSSQSKATLRAADYMSRLDGATN